MSPLFIVALSLLIVGYAAGMFNKITKKKNGKDSVIKLKTRVAAKYIILNLLKDGT